MASVSDLHGSVARLKLVSIVAVSIPQCACLSTSQALGVGLSDQTSHCPYALYSDISSFEYSKIRACSNEAPTDVWGGSATNAAGSNLCRCSRSLLTTRFLGVDRLTTFSRLPQKVARRKHSPCDCGNYNRCVFEAAEQCFMG